MSIHPKSTQKDQD